MKTIYKYVIKPYYRYEVSMVAGAKILSLQMQEDKICIWVLVDAYERKMEKRTFTTVGTGQRIDIDKYIGTVQDREYVWHIFEE